MLTDYLNEKDTSIFTRDQIASMDVNQSGGITIRDESFWDIFIANG